MSCFCTAQGEAAAVVSGEPPGDVAGGEVRSTGESSSSVANAGKSPCLLPIAIHRATGMSVVCSEPHQMPQYELSERSPPTARQY